MDEKTEKPAKGKKMSNEELKKFANQVMDDFDPIFRRLGDL